MRERRGKKKKAKKKEGKKWIKFERGKNDFRMESREKHFRKNLIVLSDNKRWRNNFG